MKSFCGRRWIIADEQLYFADAIKADPAVRPSAAGYPDTVKAICALLYETYQYETWPDEAKQGFTAPCFFVREIRSTQKRIGRVRRMLTQTVAVHYFPPDGVDGVNLELMDMAQKLYGLMEYITVGGSLYLGTGMNHAISDGVLIFTADYTVHALDLVQGDAMDSATASILLKEVI